MLQSKMVNFGKLNTSIFDAEDAGDLLPMHDHDGSTVHITIVARGSFRVHGDGWEMTAKAGDVIDWKVGQAHELIALEPNSRFVNIQKGGN
ncbi:cupin 2-like protein [Caudoviricetes sp.]|nr:cupin 2-like protein [Caudoviricetes sp.]